MQRRAKSREQCFQPNLLYLCIRNHFLSANDLNSALPSSIVSLLHEYKDVFSEETPHGLSPIQGIEHQIDFVLGASIPNRPAYRSNPEETKELQRQVTELMEKGYKRKHESMRYSDFTSS